MILRPRTDIVKDLLPSSTVHYVRKKETSVTILLDSNIPNIVAKHSFIAAHQVSVQGQNCQHFAVVV